MPNEKAIWFCKIGEIDREKLPRLADGPLRDVIEKEYFRITGEWPEFTFSGWLPGLTEQEKFVADWKQP